MTDRHLRGRQESSGLRGIFILVCCAAALLAACGSTTTTAGSPSPGAVPVDSGVEARGTATSSELAVSTTVAPSTTASPITATTLAAAVADTTTAPGADTTTASGTEPQPTALVFGDPAAGFALSGLPTGMQVGPVKTNTYTGPLGQTIVTQLFVGNYTPVSISRESNLDPATYVDNAVKAAAPTVVMKSGLTAYFGTDPGSGWRALFWVLPDKSTIWLDSKGMSDDQMKAFADMVVVK